MRLGSFIALLSSFTIGWSQTPPDSTLRTVEKSGVEIFIQLTPDDVQNLKTTAGTTVFANEIEKQSPEDMGDLTSKFSGVFIRSYGGTGGLKTMNARGLGSQHFLVINNQQALIFNQMGSTNLGDIQADGLSSIQYSVGGSDSWDVPTIAKTYSGILQLKYLEMNENAKDFTQIQLLTASFGRYKLSGNWLKNTKKTTSFLQAYAYQMQGDYPFEYQHGLTHVSGDRLHNFTREAAARFGVNYSINQRNKLQFSGQYLLAFRQLPGAIVFYHPDHFQELGNQQMTGNVRHEYTNAHTKLIHYANFSTTVTDYSDSFYLLKPLWQNYKESNMDCGQNGQMLLGKFKLNWSGQYLFSSLTSNRTDITHPKRHRTAFNLGGEYMFNRLKIRADIPIQFISDQLMQQPHQNRLLFTPSIGLNKAWSGKKSSSTFRISIGQFSRLASFSEMFYGQMGNPDLRPEISQMLNTGVHNKRRIKKVEVNFGIDVFLGQIKDKIIAIPTQNLFVWSVRNLQTVRSYGFDAILSLDYATTTSHVGLNFTQKSSLNIAHDRSDPQGPTFGNQIPYTPYWLHASVLTIRQKHVSFTYGYYFNDFRFVLGENIAANVLEAFQIHDIRVNYEAKLKAESKHNFRIHFKLNNLLNQQYQVMRGFPMPGRNFEIGLTWKF